jgi:hypothetical protein
VRLLVLGCVKVGLLRLGLVVGLLLLLLGLLPAAAPAALLCAFVLFVAQLEALLQLIPAAAGMAAAGMAAAAAAAENS